MKTNLNEVEMDNSRYKFRGIRDANGKWVHGWYIEWNGYSYIEFSRPDCPWYDNIRVEVIPESVGQYIGKKDNHGTEICQGDICKNGDWEPDANAYNYRIEEIIWDDGNAAWSGWNPNDYGMCCEIIGNVQENRELLTEKSHA